MKKCFLICVLLLAAVTGIAQSFMNEWVEYGKPYYKFKIGATGVYRISQADLVSIGLGNTDAAHFQLWNKGKEIPIYTSVEKGLLPSQGFIEFWGETNDGEWEKRLYIKPEYQINPLVSLFTDTAVYFLTVNKKTLNRRLKSQLNSTNSTVPAEPYFTHTIKGGYHRKPVLLYSFGYGALVGEEVFSSSYDSGEGYVSLAVGAGQTNTLSLSNLMVAPGAGGAQFRYTAAGRNPNIRNIITTVNGTILDDRQINYYDCLNNKSEYIQIPQNLISTGTLSIEIKNSVSVQDRLFLGMYELIYPRIFDFGGQTNFNFELPAANVEKKLVIKNFNHEGATPVLYDLTNGLRFEVLPQNSGEFMVVLPASPTSRKLVFTSMASARIGSVTAFTSVNFINYSLPSNQGDFLIISNPLIYKDANQVNQVEEYAKYRSSTAGGSYKVLVSDINQIIDQFGWGIKNNALAIRNFLRFGRKKFPFKEQYCLLIGKGIVANQARVFENRNAVGVMNLVPTFGMPASDMILGADEGSIIPRTHIGRLNVINAEEIKEYLEKLKIYEEHQRNKSCSIDDEWWKKQVLHVGGANDFLGEQIMYYLNQYEKKIKDTLFGANVFTLQKSSQTNIQVLAGEKVNELFANGFSLLTYFGHSSASTLEFNLDNPQNYPYSGRFPFFVVNGCSAGNLFMLDSTRLTGSYTLSEKYVVSTPLKGAIGFLASTHLGLVSNLHLYTEEFYRQLTKVSYGKSIGIVLTNVIDSLINRYTMNDYFVRVHAEQITLHGDPALVLNYAEKPDYAIETKNVKISPEFISIAEDKYKASIQLYNIGRAGSDSVFVRIVRITPGGTPDTLFNRNLSTLPNTDSIQLQINLNSQKDKGLNKLVVTIDPDNNIDEFCESNNTVTKDYFVFEDEIRPVYPYNYSIVNKKDFTFYASTANPLSDIRTYYFQIDTTQQFNSSLLKEKEFTTYGGLLEFSSVGMLLKENTVYYWRVGLRPGLNMPIQWSGYSFIYRPDLGFGYNQSHYHQFTSNTYNETVLDSASRKINFKNVTRKLKIRTGLFPYFNSFSNDVFLDLQQVDFWRCNWNIFSIFIFEPKSLIPWLNFSQGSMGTYQSLPVCNSPRKQFEFSMSDPQSRNNARLLLDSIVKDSALVLVINQGTAPGSWAGPNNAFIQQWMSDTALYGKDKSIYHTLKKNGFTQIDSFTRNLPFAFLFKKGDPGFVRQFIGEKEYNFIDVVVDLPAQLQNGSMESPWLGPNKSWDSFIWDGEYKGGRSAQDSTFFDIIGKKNDGSEQLLATVLNAKDTSISFIDASLYPYLKLKMRTQDSTMLTPFQLKYWRLTGTPIPEGALMPNVSLIAKDTAEIGEQYAFAIAFKNISATAFDSLKLKFIITDKNNKQKEILFPRQKPLVSGDTILIKYTINIDDLEGLNRIYLMVNPDNDQPEQYLYNNFIYKDFFVRRDTEKPWLDVTFDGVHILNRDIVSAKPHILIQLKDENKFRPVLNQDSVIVEIRFPDQSVRKYRLGSDSARITASDLSTGKNELVIDVLPYCDQDGEYELIVYPQNQTAVNKLFGTYRINFQVINKPMISHLFNYPNPFTSSTAFVFTLTGSEIPQNLRIQVMTVTGKVVREITRQELGTIRIGKNITDYKWDGTDQYGNQLGNGVYLYRVITNLNGKQLDHYKVPNAETDQYFNNGYGKMYLMR